MKVVIYTMQPLNSLPPRIRMEKQILEDAGCEVEVCGSTYTKKEMTFFEKLMYYSTLSYFRWDLIKNYRLQKKKGDIAIVYDLCLLPLTKNLSKSFNRIIYETLDNNVALTFFHLSQQYPFIKPAGNMVKGIIAGMEKKWIRKHTDHLIVNSQYLYEILGGLVDTTINIYASPFEKFSHQTAPADGHKPAFLYLGIFSADKGAETVLELQSQYNIPLYIFGDPKFKIPNKAGIFWQNRMPIDELYSQLSDLLKEFRFIGISLIKSTNESYANQEANKEADYLSLGIPFIGNQRRTTLEKIREGVGCFLHENHKISQLINDAQYYASVSEQAKKYYAQNLSMNHFKQQLLGAVHFSDH